ncbi:MAG: ATP-binding protein [Chitinophagales bacterium]|jgi:nicotinamide riboside kinase|nr:ATP-binding protein [Chitinophagales bacterium]
MTQFIAITGPESTGKSTLAQFLSQYYQTYFLPEYAREYLQDIKLDYTKEDVLKIAEIQNEREDKFRNFCREKELKYAFFDTTLVNLYVWMKFANIAIPSWVISAIEAYDFRQFLLLSPDIPWQDDGFRNLPNHREIIFDLFQETLTQFNFGFRIIKGENEQRNIEALNAIEKY